jgi:L-rhamnose mutarotase
MKRFGSMIRVRKEAIEEYKRHHAAVWPEVLSMIQKCNIRNYSIYLKDDVLFG